MRVESAIMGCVRAASNEPEHAGKQRYPLSKYDHWCQSVSFWVINENGQCVFPQKWKEKRKTLTYYKATHRRCQKRHIWLHYYPQGSSLYFVGFDVSGLVAVVLAGTWQNGLENVREESERELRKTRTCACACAENNVSDYAADADSN